MSKWLRDYDTNDDDVLDAKEYGAAAVYENYGNYKYENKIEEYATLMDEDGLLMGNDELEETYDYEANNLAQLSEKIYGLY